MAVTVPRYQRQVGTPDMTTAVFANPRPLQIGAEVTADAGNAAQNIGQQMAAAQVRINRREDAARRALEASSLSTELADDFRARRTSNDLMTSEQVQQYREYLDGRIGQAVNNHKGSLDSKAALQERLLNDRDRLLDEASFAALESTRAVGRADLEKRFRPLANSVVSDPSRLPEAYAQADAIAADYADLYTPEEDLDRAALQRAQLAAAAVEGYMARGLYNEAADLVQMPGVVEAMTPEQQSNFQSRLLQARERENAQWNAFQQNLRVSAAALGTTVDALPTWARVQAAGMQMPQAPTFQPTTDVGKAILEREAFKSQFGEDSQIYADYVAASEAEMKGEPPDLSDVAGMRKEFTGLSKDFVTIRDAFNKLSSIDPNRATPASDMSLIFGYMKMLDPGSTVREGEYASAQNTTGIPGRVLNMYNQAINGQFLAPEQRQNFIDEARMIYGVQAKAQKALTDNFSRLAERAGMNPDDVVGPLRDMTTDASPPDGGGADAQATQQAAAPSVIQYGLDGLPVGGATATASAPQSTGGGMTLGPSSAAAAEVAPARPQRASGGADGQIDPAIIDEVAAFAQSSPDAGQYFEQMAEILDRADEEGRAMTLQEAYEQAKAGGGG